MKRSKQLTIVLITGMMMITAVSSFAQKGQGRKAPGMSKNMPMHQNCYANISNLTEEQEKQIETLKTDHLKEMKGTFNKLNEKRARLRTLQTQDEPDMEKIYEVIEEMGDLRTEMNKARAKHHQEVRSLLNEKQKLYFDKHQMKMHKGMKPHNNMKRSKGHHGGCGKM